MKIVIASDSFKGSASTIEVANFIEKGIRNLNQAVEIVKIPIADGGEGTVESLVLGCNGEYQYLEVVGPAGNKIKAKYGFVNRDIAIIEMAQASGLHIIKDRNKK